MTTRIRRIRLGGVYQCYVLQGEGTIMVDCGPVGRERRFLREIARLGLDPQNIVFLVLTHGHWDHMGLARDIVAITGARTAIHEADKVPLEKDDRSLSAGMTTWGRVMSWMIRTLLSREMHAPATEVDVTLGSAGLSLHEHGIAGTVVHTPGHTPGSVSVLLETGDAFVGDLVMNGFPFRRGPGLPIFYDDMDQVRASLSKLLDLGARTLHPGHGEPFPADCLLDALQDPSQ